MHPSSKMQCPQMWLAKHAQLLNLARIELEAVPPHPNRTAFRYYDRTLTVSFGWSAVGRYNYYQPLDDTEPQTSR